MKKILGVTSCPTGIAHTYMAKEAIEVAAEKAGYKVKIETDGASGVENKLTAEDIESCEGIIIAADTKVETERFDGKKVINVSVSEGISNAEKLIAKIINDEVPIYHAKKQSTVEKQTKVKKKKETTEAINNKPSAGKEIYKHLMNGVSFMLPFVVGGGILIALAFLFDDYTIDPSNFGMNKFLPRILKTIGNTGFGFMLPVLAGYIAYSIADRPGLAVGFVGGSLASAGISFSSLAGTSAEVSAGFLGALLAGFVSGYTVIGLKKITKNMPKSMDGIKPMLIYPLAGMFVIGIVMLLINPIMASINVGISNWLSNMGGSSRVVLGIVLGAMMCTDMGGPINKAAYVFGTASLSTGNYDIMAAVMVGGMIPPIAIAFSTTFAKKKWSKKERQNGYVNYIMGLCFITEGAIPYAAKDPLRVIPSCMVGGAVGGAISMAFGCTLMAPHGGIFVFPVVGNVGGYLIALIVGALVGGIILTLLKKDYNLSEDME